MENENALKHMYNQAVLKQIGESILREFSTFDKKAFTALFKTFDQLEMKPRVRAIRDELKRQLPDDFPKSLKILLSSIRKGQLTGFALWPYTEFIQMHGLGHPTLSLDALKEITRVFTAEWAVRPFLNQDSKASLAYLMKASVDKDVHVRRWSSEGSRPRLPWGERLNEFIKAPELTLPILENLKYDDELYVRKSVANHLNDIAKDNPEVVVKVLKRWLKDAPEKHAAKIDWITRHALRTLIKAGNPKALELLGVSSEAAIEVSDLKLKPNKLHFGESLNFSFNLRSKSKKPQKLVVDYVIHFVKANGKTAPKVFKLKNLTIESNASVTIEKNHAVRKITTREYFPGLHTLSIQVNGKVVAKKNWTLVIAGRN